MSYVILKFDDLNEETLGSFEAAWEICKRYGAVPCFGLIGSSLERPSESYLSSLKRMRDAGVELWNHGYFHSEEEFSKCTYQQQKESIEMTQLLMAKHLGARARTFGSPHNNSTEKTVQVLTEHFPEIRNLFFMADGKGRSNARTLLMRCNYEIKTGKVDIDFFKREYKRIKGYPYFVLQGHPSFWEDEDAQRFEEILKILSLDDNEIVTAEGLRKKDVPNYKDSSIQDLIESLTDFYVSHDKVYYYGAGEIGREVYRYFSLRGMTPDAFLVSDGHMDLLEVCGKHVLEFGEVYGSSAIYGIIPTILGRSHASVFGDDRFKHVDLWMPESVDLYDRMIDHIRFDRCCLWGSEKNCFPDEKTIKEINDRLVDDESKSIFASRVMYSITGDCNYLTGPAQMFKNKVRNDDRWKDFIRILKEAEKNNGLMLYGAGSFGGKLLDMTKDIKWNGLIDRSASSETMRGLPIVNTDDYLNSDREESIVISSKRYYEDITRYLTSHGVDADRIIDGTVLYDLTEGSQYFDLDELPHCDEREIFLDVGCYDGMSSVGFMKWCNGNGYCYCFEPDEKNVAFIKKVMSDKGMILEKDYELIHKGVWDIETELSFISSGDYTSHVANISYIDETPVESSIPVTTIDKAVGDKPVTYVKMDIEGSELKALQGTKKLIAEKKPILAISIYHKPEDIWEIPSFIMGLHPDYRFYLRHYSFDIYETVLYAICDGKTLTRT